MEKENTKTLVILRGISGSGKSTLSKKLIEDNKGEGLIFSTDDYFISEGKYIFKPENIGKAHVWNQKRSKEAMESEKSLIIIDNTNTQKWEAKPYVVLGQKHGYKIIIQEPTTSWAKDAEELAKRNTHKVPLEAIKRMLQRWENDFTVENILKCKDK